jgi:hypothetical protein
MVAKLSDAGTTIAAQRQREQQVASLNRDADPFVSACTTDP